jgi:preprotein translocase subunit YajC
LNHPGTFAFQAVPEAAQHSASQPAGGENPAQAPAASPGGIGGMLFPLLLFLPIILLLFWQSRSQQKKQEATLSGLKKGDRVITQSGLIGRLSSIEGRYAKLELLPAGTKVTMLKSSIIGRDADETPASATATTEEAAEKKKS